MAETLLSDVNLCLSILQTWARHGLTPRNLQIERRERGQWVNVSIFGAPPEQPL